MIADNFDTSNRLRKRLFVLERIINALSRYRSGP